MNMQTRALSIGLIPKSYSATCTCFDLATETNQMNTAEKEMLRMLSLFTFSYLPYATDHFVKSNNTKMPMKPIK
jgi:hypothetical protein